MAAEDTASIALLHRLRAGATVDFVHNVDVCSAAPEDLAAGLEPVPDTSTVWYFYCVKKYKSAHGRPGGHRQRAIAASDTCWHSEGSAKNVEGGGTVCNLSYGRKDGRSFSRLGWCMMEYDDATGGSDHVLCRIYRSPRAQGKLSSKTAKMQAQPSSGPKRNAGGEHPEARPSKSFREQDAFFTDDYAAMPSTVAQVNVRGEAEQLLSTQDGEFVETTYGLLPSDVAEINAEEWIRGMEMFGGEEEEQSSKKPVQDDGFVKVAPLVTEDISVVEDCLLASVTTSGEATGMTADVDILDVLEPESEFRVVQEQQTLQMQQPHEDCLLAPETTSSEASRVPLPATFTSPDDIFDALERDSALDDLQEQQSLQMQQPHAAEEDPMAELARTDLDTPYAAAMALPCQLQESDWMMRSLLQEHPAFLMCSSF